MKVVEQLKSMSEERFLGIYESLAEKGFGPLDHEVAQALNFRPQAVRKLAMPMRAKKARSILISRGQAELCYELFGSYLIGHQKELVTGFLDAVGVAHEDGMIEDLEEGLPDEKKIASAVKELDSKFEPEDVTLYLSIAAEQWPGVNKIDELWRARVDAAVSS
jgi:hypothetical protein